MAQTIKIKRSSTSGNKLTSSNSVAGELGLNTADKALYIQTGSSNGDVVTVAHESTLKIDESNGRIGIGNTSPSATLEVGTLTSGSTGNVIINSEGGNPPALNVKSRTNRARIQVQDNDTSGYIIAEDSVFSIGFADSLSANNLNITNSYNVGIGTTAPAAPIHVQTVHEIATIIQSSHNNGTHFVIRNSDATTGRKAIINLAPANNVTGAYIGAEAMEDFSTTANRTADLFFSTRKDGTLAERMRIDSSGNLLVGKTSAAFTSDGHEIRQNSYAGFTRNSGLPLLVNRRTSSGDMIEFYKDSTSIGTIGSIGGANLFINSKGSGGYGRLQDNGTDIAVWWSNGFYPATDSAKDLGVNTTSGRWRNLFLSNKVHAAYIGAGTDTDTSINFDTADTIKFVTGNSERMRIDSSGRVLIGRTSSIGDSNADDLEVGNGSGAHGITIMSQNTHNGNIFFADNDNNDAGSIRYNHTSNRLELHTNRAERMRIDSSGNVLVGTTASAPQNFSSGSGTQISDGYIAVARGGSLALLNRISTDGDIIEFKKDGSLIGNIGVDGGDMYLRTGITGVIFNDANNAILPYRTNTEDDANIDLGHPSYRFQDFYLSGNIQMGGNLDVVGQIGAYNNPSSSWGTMNFRATDYIFKNSGGTAKMSLDASGRLGINQTPLANNFALQVTGLGGGAGDARAVYLKGSGAHTSIGSTGPTLTLQNTNSTVNNIVKLSFESASSGETVSINAINTNHSSHYGDMAFNTRGSSGYSEKMRIMANGNVGIGTQNPAAKLHISGNSDISDEDCMLIIDDVDGSAGSRIPAIMFRSNTGGTVTNQARIRGTDTQGLKISGSSALGDDLVVQSGGVGIGTSSPDNKLHVYKGDSGHSWSFDGGDGLILENSDSLSINITTPAANSGNILFSDANARGQGRIVYDHSADYMGFMTAGVSNEHVRILSSGKVGIGTTNPIYTLVVSEDGTDNIEIGGGVIQRYNRSSSAYQAMNYYAYSHNFYTTGGGHQSLFIKNDGNVGIGTSTPYSGTNVRSLTVNATSYPALALQIGGNNAGLLMSNSSGTDLYALGNKRLQFKTDDTTRIRIAGTGGITFNEEYTFPTSDGSANQVLKTDGSGNLSFVTIAGAGAITEIEDADGDTKIQVEESSDEDKIRLDIAGTERVVVDGTDFIVDNIALKVKDPGGTFSWNVNKYGYNTTRSSTITQLSATGDHAMLPFSILADVSSTRTKSYMEVGDIGSAGNRFKIDNTGRVGIGTTAPSAPLHVVGADSGIKISSDASDRPHLSLVNGTTEMLRLSANNSFGAIGDGTSSERYMTFINGSIGIGTNNPGAKVTIVKSTNATNGVTIQNATTGTSARSNLRLLSDAAQLDIYATSSTYSGVSSWADAGVISTSSNASGGLIFNAQATGHIFQTGTVERMRIDSSGRLLLGVASATGYAADQDNFIIKGSAEVGMHLIGGTSSTTGINFGDGTSTDAYRGQIVYHNADDSMRLQTAGSERMRIDSSGRVGIGTTSPARTLDIVGDFGVKKGSSAIAFNEYSNGATIWLDGSDGDFTGGDYFNISAYGTTDLAFGYGAATKITMKNDGKLGIGITAPASNLHVKTSVDNSVSQGIVVERSLNSDRGYINYSGGAFQFRSTVGDPIVFGETDAEHMRILPDGNVGIGTTTPDEFGIGSSFRILSVGGDATGVVNIVDNNTNGSYLQFGNAAGLRRASIHSLDGSNLIFTLNSNNSGTALTERMRIERTGDWMVGNTVSRVASHYGNQAGIGWREADHHFEAATTYNRSAAEFGRNNANSGDVITIRQQGTSVGMIGTEGGDSLVIQSNGSTGSGLRFHPSVASIQPVRQGVTIDATISLGADTRRFKDLHLSASANIGHASIQTDSTTTSATTQVAIDAFAASEFRSAEFTIQVTNSTDSTYHLTKILLIHDGTTPGITEYGTVFTGSAAEATFDADISSGNVRLLATPASTDSMTFKVVRHCITV